MGDDESASYIASAHHLVECRLHHELRLRVERTCGFIEEHDGRIADNRAGNCQALFLAATHLDPLLSTIGLKASREILDKFPGVGLLADLDDFFFRDTFAFLPGQTVDDVLADRGGEEDVFLRHDGHTPPEVVNVVHANRLSVEQNPPVVGPGLE